MPLPWLVRAPLVGLEHPGVQVTVVVVGSRSPSGSLSLAATSMVTGWVAVVEAVSSVA